MYIIISLSLSVADCALIFDSSLQTPDFDWLILFLFCISSRLIANTISVLGYLSSLLSQYGRVGMPYSVLEIFIYTFSFWFYQRRHLYWLSAKYHTTIQDLEIYNQAGVNNVVPSISWLYSTLCQIGTYSLIQVAFFRQDYGFSKR